MVTRTQVAEYVADKLSSGRTEAVQEAAAWLVATGRARQAQYLSRDVAKALAERGYMFARITSARTTSETARRAIEAFLKTQTGATTVELELGVDANLIGGVRIETPTAELDASVRQTLAQLVEGVHQ